MFFSIKIVKNVETVELLGSVATILSLMLVSFEFYVPYMSLFSGVNFIHEGTFEPFAC